MFGSNNPSATKPLFGAAGTTTSGGLFGAATSQPAAGGGLFGSANATTSAPAAGGNLFGASAAATTAPAPSGNLFGASAATTAPAAGGLFGTSAAATTAPATGGLFGTSRPASASGLFGGGATASTPSAGTLFGGGAATSDAAKPAAPLFGNMGAPSSAGTLFGANAAKPAATQAPTLFGNQASTAPATSTPAAGGLFGTATSSAPATGGPFGTATTPAPSTGGLFGTAAAQPSSQAPAASLFSNAKPAASLFGSAPPNQPASSQPAASLQPATASQAPAIPSLVVTPATTSSNASALFGKPAATNATSPAAATATANAPTTSLFGGFGGSASQPAAANTTSQASTSLFANARPATASSFGNTPSQASQPAPLFASLGTAGPSQFQQQQQQQIVPGVKIDLSNIKPTTRYFELHDDLQREIDRVENFIQQQIQLFTQCGAFMPEHGNKLKTIPQDVDFVQKQYETATQALQGDAADIAAVQAAVQTDIEDARRVFTAIENQKLPLQYQYSTSWPAQSAGPAADGAFSATDLLPYFEARSDELAAKLQRYQRQLVEIEAHLRTVEASATEQMQRLLRRNGSGEGESGGGTGRERVADLVDAMRTFEEAVLRVAARVGEARQGVIECTLDGSTLGNGNGRGSSRVR